MGTIYISFVGARFVWPFVDLFSSPVAASVFAYTLLIMESGTLSALDFEHDGPAWQGTIGRGPDTYQEWLLTLWPPRPQGLSVVVIRAYHGNSSGYRLPKSFPSGLRKSVIRESTLLGNVRAIRVRSLLNHPPFPSSKIVKRTLTSILRNHQRQTETFLVPGKLVNAGFDMLSR